MNAACREAGITYSRFMEGLKAASIQLDRRQLSEIAIADATAFAALVKQAQAALKSKAAKA
jgi:large subunit ribosomal protein L20